ncbi:MAG: hypothetical protein VKJ64_00470 [Leptolyngbyaceae bacterium]|nr:hypothetical protein [Leptolyngbyaceae bacterium]
MPGRLSALKFLRDFAAGSRVVRYNRVSFDGATGERWGSVTLENIF